jgi:hypothetical protein
MIGSKVPYGISDSFHPPGSPVDPFAPPAPRLQISLRVKPEPIRGMALGAQWRHGSLMARAVDRLESVV